MRALWLLAAVQAACSPRGGYDIVVRDLGSEHVWHELGGSATLGGVSAAAASAVCHVVRATPSGRLYVAWTDDSTGQEEVYLRAWDGVAWAPLGGSTDSGGVSQGSGVAAQGDFHTCVGDLSVGAAERPYLVWMSYHGGTHQPTYLKYWTGALWAELDGSATAGGISGDGATWWPVLAIDRAARPTVAWMMAGEIYLRRYAGGWSGVGGSDSGLTGGNGAELVTLAAGADDALYVAWPDEPTGVLEIYLTYWNGVTWGGLGGSADGSGLSATGVGATRPTVATMAQGSPVVAWADETADTSTVQVRFWDGARWSTLGGAATLAEAGIATGAAFHPCLALDHNDAPVLAWEEDDDVGRNIHAGRWTGSAWESLDPTQPGGVSHSATRSEWPAVAVGADGVVYVAWEAEQAAGKREIYLKALW